MKVGFLGAEMKRESGSCGIFIQLKLNSLSLGDCQSVFGPKRGLRPFLCRKPRTAPTAREKSKDRKMLLDAKEGACSSAEDSITLNE
ncbi:MAG: hypothetical protein QOG92_762 [Verrucomicrobiota bacterium]|nr:hypothetical protein [Verrucomicrobiota bacterium]